MEEQKQVEKGVTISQKEAEEYRAYKRQKKISEITSAMRQSESVLTGNDSASKLCEQVARLRQTSVRMRPSDLLQRGDIFKRSGVKIDCLIGGNGETFPRVKAYEAKQAIRAGAKELTVILTPSLIASSRYTELKKELRRVRRAAGKIPLKARVEKSYPQATLSRLARLCSEMGIQYLSMPYFLGCERAQADLLSGCRLEVTGVDNLADFKKMAGAGMGRIVTGRGWEIYAEWLKEVEQIFLPPPEQPKAETKPSPLTVKPAPPIEKKEENGSLKFL